MSAVAGTTPENLPVEKQSIGDAARFVSPSVAALTTSTGSQASPSAFNASVCR